MDELLAMVLCAASAGIIIGSSGTIVTFWCCGTFERCTVSGRINLELENALIQAGSDMARVFQVRQQDRFNCVELRPFQ